MNPKTLDHVALWVADRDAIAGFLVERLRMRVIERTDAFTLVGADARRGKLTLFAADAPRERGALDHVALRVADPASLDGTPVGEPFEVAEGLHMEVLEAAADVAVDLDHAALFSRDPAAAAHAYVTLGFRPVPPGPANVPRVEVGGAFVEFHDGEPGDPERPLLNHLAVLVESADEHLADAEELGLEVADFVDAANTRAVFVWGPERVKIEYVEHKPSFSLV